MFGQGWGYLAFTNDDKETMGAFGLVGYEIEKQIPEIPFDVKHRVNQAPNYVLTRHINWF